MSLPRRLGTLDAVLVGMGSMLGAGVFAAIAPAAEAAGGAMLLSIVIAGAVAFSNATSSAQLAALYPAAGGTYVYAGRRLGGLWGYLAGWSFVTGKVASCAAIALTFGYYAYRPLAVPLALLVVWASTGANLTGVRKTAGATGVVVVTVVVALAVIVAGLLLSGPRYAGAVAADLRSPPVLGVLQASGFMFFAFAGYARIATLGEEVHDPARTIPKAIPLALGLVLAMYLASAAAALLAIGPGGVASAQAPLAEAMRRSDFPQLAPVARFGASVATLGVLLSLLAGVSRTTLAMARDRRLPSPLAAVHPRFGVPHRAEVAVALAVSVLVLTADFRSAIGFSSFVVLSYYAITNAAAWTLLSGERRWPRPYSVLGFIGCLALAFTLPSSSVAAGAAVLAAGVLAFSLTKTRTGS